jgi:hypothetical protein
MKLFYYCGVGGLKILENLEIKITSPNEFNDPFEFYPSPTGEQLEEYEYCDAFHNASFGMVYFLCLSRDPSNPRMWAQYSDNHKGLLFEFDMTQEPFCQFTYENKNLIKVDYSKEERIPFSEFKDDPKAMFHKLAERKGKYWEQEQEIRLFLIKDWIDGEKIIVKNMVIGESIISLMKLTKESIVSVTVGLRASDMLVRSTKRLIEMNVPDAILYQAYRSKKGFNILRNELGTLNKT